jgi:hypothetical protein
LKFFKTKASSPTKEDNADETLISIPVSKPNRLASAATVQNNGVGCFGDAVPGRPRGRCNFDFRLRTAVSILAPVRKLKGACGSGF